MVTVTEHAAILLRRRKRLFCLYSLSRMAGDGPLFPIFYSGWLWAGPQTTVLALCGCETFSPPQQVDATGNHGAWQGEGGCNPWLQVEKIDGVLEIGFTEKGTGQKEQPLCSQ